MEKVLLYGMCGMDNLGDDLMFYAVKNRLQESQICVSFIKRNEWKSYFSDEEKCYCTELSLYNSRMRSVEYRIMKYFPFPKLIESLKRRIVAEEIRKTGACALLFLGGGYISSNQTVMTENELKNILLIVTAAKESNIPVIFSGLTVGPFISNNDLSYQLAHDIFLQADYISVREQYSLKILKEMGISGKLTGDNIFLIPESKKKQADDFIIVNIKAHKEQAVRLEQRLNHIIRLCYDKRLPVKIVPFRSDDHSEEVILNKDLNEKLIAAGIKSEVIIPKTVHELMDIYEKSALVIGSSYHSLALALFHNKSVYTWYEGSYYTYKIKGLLTLFKAKVCNSLCNDIIMCTIQPERGKLIRETVRNEWNLVIEMIKEHAYV